jgi:hypothetical protein
VHLTLLDSVRTFLTAARLPKSLWAEAVSHATYLRNRVPSKPNNTIPEELWTGEPVKYDHLRPFGSTAFYRIHEAISKLEPRYAQGVFVGYVSGTTTCRIWDSARRRLMQSRDVIFSKTYTEPQGPQDELALVNLEAESLEPAPAEFVDIVDPAPLGGGEDIVIQPLAPAINEAIQQDEPGVQRMPVHHGHRVRFDVPIANRRRSPRFQQLANNAEPVDNNSSSDSDSSEDPLDVISDDEIAPANLAIALHAAASATPVPKTFLQAIHSTERINWKEAMDAELGKQVKYKVYDLMDHQSWMRLLDGKWVYTQKIDGETGEPGKFKARWVVKGYEQVEGLDYGELFASVSNKDTFRVFLAMVCHEDYECDQVDVNAAFLNADLEEEVYMHPPEGSDIPRGKVLRLRKALYGLKQAPRAYNKTFDAWLQSQGFRPGQADPCLYTRRKDGHFIMLSIHVDDQLIASDSRPALDQFKSELNAKFECTDYGPVNYFLGFNVYRDRPNRKLWISMEHYLESVLARFDMSSCNPSKTPLPSGFKPIAATDSEHAQAKSLPYPQMVGCVIYAMTVARPDLAQPASVLSRFVGKWNSSHFAAAKHLLRYIRGTSDLCLVYNGDSGKRIIQGYADADWGGDLDTRRSTTGYLFKVWGGLVAWKSKRQPTVALSTTEAEYMASSAATRQATWLRVLLNDLGAGLPVDEPISINNDNKGCIALSKNPVHHERSKHIDMQHHYLRQNVEEKKVSLDFVPSADNLADMLTKSLPYDTMGRLRDEIGMEVKK